MPGTPLEGQKKFSSPLRGSENFSGSGTASPQAQKPSYSREHRSGSWLDIFSPLLEQTEIAEPVS